MQYRLQYFRKHQSLTVFIPFVTDCDELFLTLSCKPKPTGRLFSFINGDGVVSGFGVVANTPSGEFKSLYTKIYVNERNYTCFTNSLYFFLIYLVFYLFLSVYLTTPTFSSPHSNWPSLSDIIETSRLILKSIHIYI